MYKMLDPCLTKFYLKIDEMKNEKCKELKLNINRRKNIKRIIRIKLFKKKENDNRKWEV